jgi:hypothetical protein
MGRAIAGQAGYGNKDIKIPLCPFLNEGGAGRYGNASPISSRRPVHTDENKD